MRKFRVRVTTDLEEYLRWTEGNFILMKNYLKKEIHGMYFDGYIWVNSLKPSLLFHEFIHHLLGNSKDVWYISVRLFLDFLNTLWDVSYFRLTRIRVPKEGKIEALRRLKESWKDWLDWMFCK